MSDLNAAVHITDRITQPFPQFLVNPTELVGHRLLPLEKGIGNGGVIQQPGQPLSFSPTISNF